MPNERPCPHHMEQPPKTEVAQDDLAQLYRLVRQVFTRTPSRELRKAIQLLEPYLPEAEHSSSPTHNRHREQQGSG
jgi:hypothetical protein